MTSCAFDVGSILLVGFCFLSLVVAEPSATPAEEKMAPDFTASATGDKKITLSALRGQWIILYFYPKADTPGCTKESCSLRDGFAQIKEAGAVILGVSLDSVESQEKFKKKYGFPFDLISDADKTIAKAYDVLAVGGLVAKRKTFLIDPEGRIAHVFEKVDVGSHDTEVLTVLKELQKKH